jgi:hypothetical protein
MSTFRAKIFISKDGDRFLVPGFWYDTSDAEFSSSSLMLNAMMFAVVCGCKTAPGWLEVETDADGRADIPNQPYDLIGRQFEHGGIHVMLIGGPVFAECWTLDHPDEAVPVCPLTDEEEPVDPDTSAWVESIRSLVNPLPETGISIGTEGERG